MNKFHKPAWSGDNWEICQEALRIMKGGTADEMERSAGQQTFVEKLCVSAEGGTQMLHQITKPTLWRGCASLFKNP